MTLFNCIHVQQDDEEVPQKCGSGRSITQCQFRQIVSFHSRYDGNIREMGVEMFVQRGFVFCS